ncbi:hypothetical protein SDC9_156592 [bioreactor metagenome]|uniref:Uncharacterized protein n=1 Tax=bioreactor metagenome TaxID=1076179 RepID=A0A645FA12_9ZZZZ
MVDKILKKIGLTQENLLCKGTYSLNEDYKTFQISNHIKLTPANSDCSGKHSGMLASCLAKGYDIENYNSINHPIQKDIKKLIADFCEIDEDKIVIGVDGCGVPVHGIPLYNAALAFAKFTCTDNLQLDVKNACDRIFKSMNNAPEMVAGIGGFCTELIKNTNGKLIGKLGADGVYCVAVKGADIGIAMGGLGSDAAIEAADIVIMTDEPSKIATAIKIAKKTRVIVVQNIAFALGVKGLFLLLGASGHATMWEAVFADVGVAVIAILNATRVMNTKNL